MPIRIKDDVLFDFGYYVSPVDEYDIFVKFLSEAQNHRCGFSMSFHVASEIVINDECILSHSQPLILEYRYTMGLIKPYIDVIFDRLQNHHEKSVRGSGGTFNEPIGIFVNILTLQYNNNPNDEDIVTSETDDPDEENDNTLPENENDYGTLRKALRSTLLGALAARIMFLPPGRKQPKSEEILKFYQTFYPTLVKFLFTKYYLALINLQKELAKAEFEQQVIVYDDKSFCIAASDPTEGEIIFLYRQVTNRYVPIHNIRNFLNYRSGRKDFMYCRNCFKFHNQENCPKMQNIITKRIPIKPNYRSKLKSPMIGAIDFEAIIKPNGKHKLASYAYVITLDKEYLKQNDNFIHTYTAKKSINDTKYLIPNMLNKLRKTIQNIINSNFKSNLHSSNCGRCGYYAEKRYGKRFCYKTLTHHIVCTNCKFFLNDALVLYFHNLKGYDSNFLLKALINLDNEWDINIFAKQANQVMTISLVYKENNDIRILFKDSFDLFYCSIAQLAKCIPEYEFTPKEYIDAFNMGKGVFPYEWFDNKDKLKDKQLPQDDTSWFNKFTNEQFDKQLALRTWDFLECKNFEEFLLHYNIMDCFLLLEGLKLLQYYTYYDDKLDITDYLGIPSISWELAIRKCPKQIIVEDSEKLYNIFQQGITGGVAQVMHRYANHKQFNNMIALDVNALYSYCMTKKLPYEYVQTLDTLDYEIIMNTDWEKSEFDYFLFVDLQYPVELHDISPHDQYPLAPERYLGKLCTTLFDKTNYFVNVQNLQFYLKNGLVLTKIHEVYQYKQAYLFKDYVIDNINKRNTSTNKVTKDNFKLKNNAMYGKSCENVFKYQKIRLLKLNDCGDYGLENPKIHNATGHITLNENYAIVTNTLDDVVLEKPCFIGASILFKAKYVMYDFIYSHLFKLFNPKDVQLCYTDTDSLFIGFRNTRIDPLMQLKNGNAPVDINFDKNGFEIAPSKTLGLWSNDLADYNFAKIQEGVFIRAKMYIIKLDNGQFKGRIKGIRKSALKDDNQPLDFNDYKNALFFQHDVYISHYLFHKKEFNIQTVKQRKLAINIEDTKRLGYGVFSIPLGYQGTKHKKLTNVVDNTFIE